MAIVCKNNIFNLFVRSLLFTHDEVKLKNYMRTLHNWTEDQYHDYKDIFIEKLNSLPDDVELLSKEGKI